MPILLHYTTCLLLLPPSSSQHPAQPAAHGAPMVASPSPSVCIAVIYSSRKPSARALCRLGRQAIAWRLPCALAPQCEMTYAGQDPVSTRRPMLAALTALVRCPALHCTALAPIPRDRRRLCPLVLPCPCSNPSLTCCYCCYSAAASAASTPLRLRAGSETRFHPANSPRRHACLPVPAHPPIPQPAVGALSLAPSQPRCLPATRLLGMTLMLNVIPSPVNPRLTTVL